jgi:hypothetical protein
MSFLTQEDWDSGHNQLDSASFTQEALYKNVAFTFLL